MSTMHYTLKAKCQGCIALQSGSEFTCLFGIPISCKDAAGGQSQPFPYETKCYKPKTTADLKQAKLLMEKRFTNNV